jgi:TRAP-type transport system periplasmic protein
VKRLLIPVSLLLVSILVLVGCAQPAPAPAAPAPSAAPSASAAAPTTAPATPSSTAKPVQAAVKPIELSFASQGGALEWNAVHALIPWIKKVEDATKGRVKVTLYPGQTLCKALDSWVAVKTGIADMSWLTHGNFPGLTPLLDAKGLPAMNWTSSLQGSTIVWQMYQKFPGMQKEFADVKLLTIWSGTPMMLGTTKKQVKTLEDMKGFKLRNTAGTSNIWFQAMGASPILIAAPDMYMSIQKGVVDGAAVNWDLIISLRLHELLKYYTEMPSWSSACSIIMNKDKWNSLPADIQEQITSVSGMEGAKFFGTTFFPDKNTALPELKKIGVEPIVYTLPPAESDRWSKLGKSVWDEWVKQTKALGHPEAQEVLDTMLKMIADYKE